MSFHRALLALGTFAALTGVAHAQQPGDRSQVAVITAASSQTNSDSARYAAATAPEAASAKVRVTSKLHADKKVTPAIDYWHSYDSLPAGE